MSFFTSPGVHAWVWPTVHSGQPVSTGFVLALRPHVTRVRGLAIYKAPRDQTRADIFAQAERTSPVNGATLNRNNNHPSVNAWASGKEESS
jgi:hypothetical protein